MTLRKKDGMTIVETLVAIVLVSALVTSILGAFFISRLSAERAKHRMTAMNRIRSYIEQEIKAGYAGGYPNNNLYVSVDSGSPVSVIIDDRGTTDTGDDLNGTITPEPYPGTPLEAATGLSTCRYKKVGFVVAWTEELFGQVCRERAATYVTEHK
ncbi:MAG: type II secretion system protein [Candidatus Omnitrophica bacterium]|nr:type II secretion system protein [Candidatus Omnitrophota bacterium]